MVSRKQMVNNVEPLRLQRWSKALISIKLTREWHFFTEKKRMLRETMSCSLLAYVKKDGQRSREATMLQNQH